MKILLFAAAAVAVAAGPAASAPLTDAQIQDIMVNLATAASIPQMSHDDCQAVADIEAKADPDPYWQGELEFCWGDEKGFAEHDLAEACRHYNAAADFFRDPADQNPRAAGRLKLTQNRLAGAHCG